MKTLKLGNPLAAKLAMLGCAAALSMTANSFAASVVLDTVGVMNGNNKTITEATGNSVDATTFASDMTTAFANNTGGVWNFDTNFGTVLNGETVTLNYGTSLANSVVLTVGQGAGDNINQGNVAGEATSGAFELGLGASPGTRTFTLDTPMAAIGIFNTNRGDAARTSVLTVTFLDNTTASTSGANGGATFFQELSATGTNYITSFSITQSDYIRYDDLGFIAAVPEPQTYALLGAGLLVVGIARKRRRKLNIRG